MSRSCQLAEKRNLWHPDGMKTNITAPNDKRFRFPPEIISHAVWLSFRFSLSFRDVEELLAQRGIVVSYETVRQWCLKFGQTSANELRRCRLRCGDKWYLDEVVLSIRGKEHSLWRAVDQEGNVLDILVQNIPSLPPLCNMVPLYSSALSLFLRTS